MFDTKVAILILDDIATWQKLNVTAFLATGIAGAAHDAMGNPYVDSAGNRYARLLGQPMLVFAADQAALMRGRRMALERDLTCAAYIRAMFETGNDEANRQAFLEASIDAPDLVGLAVRGPKKDVDKITKGVRLHG